MKKILFILLAVVVASCTNDVELDTKTIKFKTSLPVEYENITRASLSDASAKYLYFYVDGELLITQESTTKGFGEINITLAKGKHNISIVASRDAITDCMIAKVNEYIYGYSYTLDVNNSTTDQTITLKRIISQITFKSNDVVPSDITSIELRSTFYNKYNSTTLLAEEVSVTSKVIDVTRYAGKEALDKYTSIFCPSVEEFTIKLDIIIYSGNTIVKTYTFEELPMLMNRKTNVKGDWFSNSTNTIIEVDSNWSNDADKVVED